MVLLKPAWATRHLLMQWLCEDGATPFLRAAQSGDVARMKLLLAHGADPKNPTAHNVTALAVASGIGAARRHKGRNAVVQLLVDHGKLDQHDFGSRDTGNGDMLGHTWIALNYAEGLVRVGVRSALPHPETAALLRKLMTEKGLEVPPPITSSICITQLCGAIRSSRLPLCSALAGYTIQRG
jgi:hypothetical protein